MLGNVVQPCAQEETVWWTSSQSVPREKHSKDFPINRRTKSSALNLVHLELKMLSKQWDTGVCENEPWRASIFQDLEVEGGWLCPASWKRRHWCCSFEESRSPKSEKWEKEEKKGVASGKSKEEDVWRKKKCSAIRHAAETRKIAGVGVGGVGKAPAPIQVAGIEGVYRIRKTIVLQPPAK